jgi:hypothetical protein
MIALGIGHGSPFRHLTLNKKLCYVRASNINTPLRVFLRCFGSSVPRPLEEGLPLALIESIMISSPA